MRLSRAGEDRTGGKRIHAPRKPVLTAVETLATGPFFPPSGRRCRQPDEGHSAKTAYKCSIIPPVCGCPWRR
ncbi:hypothetical protein CN070_06730 [Sinorhizobium meliloti]|nr:hypothetical protein CN070_06730 [Sinorhizobium meliloti]